MMGVDMKTVPMSPGMKAGGLQSVRTDTISYKNFIKSGASGCAESAAAFGAGFLIKRGGIYAGTVTPEAVLGAELVSCGLGSLGGMLTYVVTGDDAPQSVMEDIREGISY